MRPASPRSTRRHLRPVTVVAGMAACGLVLVGCGRGEDGGGASEDQKASGDGLVIGWSQRGISGSDWWKTLVDGGRAEAEEMGATIEVLDANRDTTQQNQDVQTLISKGVDVVVMNPQDPLGVASSVKALKDAGIPLVTVNSNLDESLVSQQFCYVAEDQVATGALAGKVIAEKAVEKFGDDAAIKLVGIGGYPGDVISELRYQGFMEGYNGVMEANADVTTEELDFKYGNWLPDKALGPMRDVATANPDLNVVFSESDVMQAGIQQALVQAGVWGDDLIEGSYDGGMESVKQMMDDPDGPLQATASNQPWDQGSAAVLMALEAYNENADACPGGTKYVETTVVTPENAADYYKPEDTYVRAQDDS